MNPTTTSALRKGVVAVAIMIASIIPFAGPADAETKKIPFKCGDEVWMIEPTRAAINAAIQRCLGADDAQSVLT